MSLLLAASPVFAEDEYGVLMKTLADPYWGAVGQGVEAGAREAGAQYYMRSVESVQAAEGQRDVCDAMLARGPVALMIAALTPANLLPCLAAAQEQGVTLVDLGGTLDPAGLAAEGIKIRVSVGSGDAAAGAQAASELVRRLGAGASGAVLMIDAPAGDRAAAARARGFTTRLAELAPGIRLLASIPGSIERAARLTDDILARYPDLTGIFAVDDDLALAAVERVLAAGRGGEVAVIAVGGTPEAVASIRAGRLSAAVTPLPYLIGKQAIAAAKRAVETDAAPARITVPTLLLTSEVIAAGTDPLLAYVR